MKRAFILLTAAALLVASMAGTAQAACWGTINVNLKVIDNGVETTSTGFFSSEVPVWAFRSGDHPYNIAVNGSGVLTIGYFPESLWICWDKYPGWIQVKKYLDGERYLLASAVGTGWLNVDFLNWQSSEHPGYYYSDYCQVDEGSETLTIKYNKRARITQKHSFNDGTGMVTYPAGSWVNTGTSQTITAPARTGYTCTGWSGGTGSIPATGTSNTVTFSLRQDSSITWNYFKPPLTVSVIGVPPANQVGFAPPVGTTYHDYDSLLAFSAPDGLDCVGWVNGTGSIPATGDVLDSSVANFRQTSSLTWDCGAPSLEVRIDGLPEFLQDDISFSPEKGTKLYAYDSLLDVTSPYLVEDQLNSTWYRLKGWVARGSFPDEYGTSNLIEDLRLREDSFIMWSYEEVKRLQVSVDGLNGGLGANIALADPRECEGGDYASCAVSAGAKASGNTYYAPNSALSVTVRNEVTIGSDLYACVGAQVVMGSARADQVMLADDRKALSFGLDRNTYLIWKYQKAQVWTVGQAIEPPGSVAAGDRDRNPLTDGSVRIIAPSGLQAADTFFWNEEDRRLYPTRDVAQAIITWGTSPEVIGVVHWPDQIQECVTNTPVELNPGSNGLVFREVSYPRNTSGNAAYELSGSVFQAKTPGMFVLRFQEPAGGDPTIAPPSSFAVAECRRWEDAPLEAEEAREVGRTIGDASHSDPQGRNGHVYYENAYYDPWAYNRATRTGPIIPVNTSEVYSDQNNERYVRQLVVVWYATGQRGVGWPVKPVRYRVSWPVVPERTITVSNGLGTGPLAEAGWSGQVYAQPDPAGPGHNPNEEHALIINGTIFALRADLNAAENASEPYVLFKYRDPALGNTWAMKVFGVTGGSRDLLRATAVAGTHLLPPSPLGAIPGSTAQRIVDADGDGFDEGKPWYHGDHTGGHWAKAAIPGLTYATGAHPGDLMVEDVTGDGNNDILTLNSGGTVTVLVGGGTGAFTVKGHYTAGSVGSHLALGDFGGGTATDVVVADPVTGNVSVLLGNADGSLNPPSAYPAAPPTHAVTSPADCDGDGKQDIVLLEPGSHALDLRRGNGDGTFQAAVTYDASAGTATITADIDGDFFGCDDTLTVETDDDRVRVQLSKMGFGCYVYDTRYHATGDGPTKIRLVDVTGEGTPDLLVANGLSDSVSVLRGATNGIFGAQAQYVTAGLPRFVELRNVNGAGTEDLVLSDPATGRLSVLAGVGDGGFSAAVVFAQGAPATTVSDRDLNNDGNLDQVSAIPQDDMVTIFLRSPGGDLLVPSIAMRWYYPLQPGFFWPGSLSPKAVGDPIPFMNNLPEGQGVGDQDFEPAPYTYTTTWPAAPPVLGVGETLREARSGLPDVAGQAVAQVIFDEHVFGGGGPLVKLLDLESPREAPLASVPGGLRTEFTGGKLAFTDLPPTLASRLFYDQVTKKLIFQGADGPLALPNVMTPAEYVLLRAFSSDGAWVDAIDALYALTRDPNDLASLAGAPQAYPYDSTAFPGLATFWSSWGLPLGVEKVAASGGYDLRSSKMGGVPLALSAAMAAGEGYVTMAVNDDPLLASGPVGMYVMRVECPPSIGDVAVFRPTTVFDETLTLRLEGDFGGDPSRFKFEWYYRPASVGMPGLPVGDNPPGWTRYTPSGGGDGSGIVEISIDGETSVNLAMTDNWWAVRYNYHTGYPGCAGAVEGESWTAWSGSGGQPQLTESWIKRVVDDLNPFEDRVKKFHTTPANTLASMLAQLGGRYEGDVALSGSAGNLNGIGLIEAYETVFRRAMYYTLDAPFDPTLDYAAANLSLLNLGSRIAEFYTLLGNEAYADAADPTIGFGTQSGEYGTLAPSIFTFQNQLPSLLDEELALLRGRDDSSTSTTRGPVYNRLSWNFTRGDGEVAYTQSYNVSDQDDNGVVDQDDARAMFPQGHGDAWGHYLTAMTTWYKLLRHPRFFWTPRTEFILMGQTTVEVDYEDERKFARVAAAKARVGAEALDLTYRRFYVDDPAGQWQGYKDTDRSRMWGVDDWARRAGQGAFLDWAVANAMLPDVDADPTHTMPLQKVDRTNLAELTQIVDQYNTIQAHLDKADKGLNPLGLANGVVPFDIDPSLVDEGQTHFEQVYERAVAILENAVDVFDFANQYATMLRMNQDTLDDFAGNVQDQERDYLNRLIEIYGYPYSGDIGSGGTYPAAYGGPDIYHYMYVPLSPLTGDAAPQTSTVTTYFRGLKGIGLFPDAGNTFDPAAAAEQTMEVHYRVPIQDFCLAMDPGDLGSRRAPGELQRLISELLKERASHQQARKAYENHLAAIVDAADLLAAQRGLQTDEIRILNGQANKVSSLNWHISGFHAAQLAVNRTIDYIDRTATTIIEGMPKSVGMSVDPSFGTRFAVKWMSDGLVAAIGGAADLAEMGEMSFEHKKEELDLATNISLETAAHAFEDLQMVKELEALIRQEPELRYEVYKAAETVKGVMGDLAAKLDEGVRLMEELASFRRSTAASLSQYRYQDMMFRVVRNDALQKYRAQFDLAARYAYLAATAYDYETNLLGSESGSGRKFLEGIVKSRSLGQIYNGKPVAGQPGLADFMARLKANFDVYKTQLGFNNPQTETTPFSLRTELFRTRHGEGGVGEWADSDETWKGALEGTLVDNLWDYPEFRRFCRPFAPESLGPQPALVIPFSTTVTFGLNFFGWPLSSGDSAYDPTNFATRVRSVGVWFGDYLAAGLSNTPRVYLIPAGMDILRSPSATDFTTRDWRIVDQKLPVPFPIGAADLQNEEWLPAVDSLSGAMGDIRQFSSFRAYHDSGDTQGFAAEMTTDSRLIGRSVWNSRWLLIIPGGTLLSDGTDGLRSFIDNVTDIQLFFQTYSYSGN